MGTVSDALNREGDAGADAAGGGAATNGSGVRRSGVSNVEIDLGDSQLETSQIGDEVVHGKESGEVVVAATVVVAAVEVQTVDGLVEDSSA